MSSIEVIYEPHLILHWRENVKNNILESEWIKVNLNDNIADIKLSIQKNNYSKSGHRYLALKIEMKPLFLPTKYNVSILNGVAKRTYLKEKLSLSSNRGIFEMNTDCSEGCNGLYLITIEFPWERKRKMMFFESDVDVTLPMRRALSSGKYADFTIEVAGKANFGSLLRSV